MIYPIIIFGVGLVIAGLYAWDDGYAPIATFILGVMVDTLVTFALTAAVWGCLYPFTGPVHHVQREQLLNLRDNSGVSGQFFLGIGQVSGNLTVSYYSETGRGYATPRSVDDSDDTIRIYQTLPAGSQPYVVRIEADPHFWTGSLYNGSNTPVEYDFHVPAGTVKQDFVLDSQ